MGGRSIESEKETLVGRCSAGELVESRLRPTAMRAFLIACGLLLAASLAACGDEPPTAWQPQQAELVAKEQQAEPVRESSATTSTTQPQLQTRTTVIKTNVEEPQTQAQLAEEAEPTRQSAQAAADAFGEDGPTDVPESTQEELTDVPAVVLAEAEVRVRPGLAWPAIDRLGIGESVSVLSRTGRWLRLSYEGGNEGWIRSGVLDLGKIEERDVLHQPAPAIIAQWQGVEYGVMGQSADAAEVRLLGNSNEIVSAPKSEVTPLASDITLDDLPVLIGDETVVFPGDDFRAGQGEILPRADEWMWLPSGWLLAHNGEYIWQWRPKTDELEFIRRPPGRAGFSPGGESLAILTCGAEESCYPYTDVAILPLDGTPMVRLMDHAEVNQSLGALKAIDILWCDDVRCHDFIWTSDGRGLLIPLVPETAVLASAAALLHADRRIVVFDPWSPAPALPEHCRPAASPSGYGWQLHSRDLVAFRVDCEGDARETTGRLATYIATGQTLTIGPALEFTQRVSEATHPYADVVNRLGDGAYELRSGADPRSIVVDAAARQLSSYDKTENQLRAINHDPDVIPDWLWELLERGPQFGYLG